jgi:hypothetical protein
MGVLKLTAISLSIALFMQSSLAFCFHKIAINSIGLKSPVSAMSPSFKLHSGSGVGNFKSSRHTCKMVSSLEDTSSAKSELLSIVSGTNMGTSESAESAQRIDLLVDKLSSQPSQFNRAVVDGEWALVFTRNSKGSPVLQRATQSVERLGGSFANFDVSRGEFYNIAEVLGGSGTLSATVKFSESSENVSISILSEAFRMRQIIVPSSRQALKTVGDDCEPKHAFPAALFLKEIMCHPPIFLSPSHFFAALPFR